VTLTFPQGQKTLAVVWAVTRDGMSLKGECATRSGDTVLVEAVFDEGPLTLVACVHRTPDAAFLRFPGETRGSEDYRRLLREVGLAPRRADPPPDAIRPGSAA
jgi:hypothetical protein